MDRDANWGTLEVAPPAALEGKGTVMRPWITVLAVLILSGCVAQRVAERNAPDVPFQGPLRPLTLSSAQLKLVQQGIAQTLKDPASASFGASYRAGTGSDGEIAVCGYV